MRGGYLDSGLYAVSSTLRDNGFVSSQSCGRIASQMELIALGLPDGIHHPGNGQATDSLPWRRAASG